MTNLNQMLSTIAYYFTLKTAKIIKTKVASVSVSCKRLATD